MKHLNALTTREQDVLDLVAEGLSNAEIGERIGTGRNTVRSHLRNVFEKVHARNRTEAAVVVWHCRVNALETEVKELRTQVAEMQRHSLRFSR